ncbi:MAG: bifunctional diaminohydroxyphosphoribosylaminopyrimidine deaminase/5-amino-6-(5-phosphoribosylamino)uracil reductase RibD [Bdellovibrionales bacterium]|nr:bifunctional diaminohydroxyphosphoribosylaminopyrimidine deaminase/5-amino-6-(5-phosphoribosylamino)uracil reductase RibD [Bdellovibrionales bacterium]
MEKTYTIDEAMVVAIEEAKKGIGLVSPNPPVGCVILSPKFELLAKGHHKVFGGNHAEIEALSQVDNKSDLEGAHVVVTLEPCAHKGKTGSCAMALSKFKLASVTYGITDPNPKVKGKGELILKEAGVEASRYRPKSEFEYLIDELELLIDQFKVNILEERSFIALKIASSMDGMVAHQSGQSQWITNSKSRQVAHHLRSIYECTAVGKNTLLFDDPKLNIRIEGHSEKSNKVLIIDPKGESVGQMNNLNLTKYRSPEQIYIAVGEDHFKKVKRSKFSILRCPNKEAGLLDLEGLSKVLYQNKIFSAFVEGGAFTVSAFAAQNFFDRFYYFVAPCILGSKTGVSWTKSKEIQDLKDKLALRLNKVEVLEGDVLLDYSRLYQKNVII